MRNSLIILLLVIQTICNAADPYPRNEAIDILHYQFKLELNDSTNRIAGQTSIDIHFKKAIMDFELDLTNINAKGEGMTVTDVLLNNEPLKFSHKNDRLKIFLPANSTADEDKRIVIVYSGIPQDGLIISTNKFGDRTFFGDNWPNRAHHWLPTIDHPYEKATCEFIVTAPEHYTIIGTGIKLEESSIGKKNKLTHWKTTVTLPTKVMVIGVARFAVKYEGIVDGVSLESWVYPQNRIQGFTDYSIAAGPLNFFNKMIAPYPYEKLANVQSTTRYGGMENAGNIFYYENSVGGKNIETLVAHEIAHQWFGDSASENDWYHVWLSEGFATYGDHLYIESVYGSKRLAEEMEKDRKKVLDFNMKVHSPVVLTSAPDLTKILNLNTYQRASWVLHMLRHDIGDEKFWQGLKEYYEKFQLDNALTDDFRAVMERVSGKDLKIFFEQWLFRAEMPDLGIKWSYDPKKKEVNMEVEQRQLSLFTIPLEIGITGDSGKHKIEKIQISTLKQHFRFASDKPVNLKLDPGTWLLFSFDLKDISK